MSLHVCRFECRICNKRMKCKYMGKREVLKHCQTQTHQDQAKSFQSQSRLQLISSESNARIRAEIKIVVLTATSNIPLAFHDKLSPAIRSLFSDSKTASDYHSASTKATCILNLAVAPVLVQELIENMRVHPFSISIDGSNDTGLEKNESSNCANL